MEQSSYKFDEIHRGTVVAEKDARHIARNQTILSYLHEKSPCTNSVYAIQVDVRVFIRNKRIFPVVEHSRHFYIHPPTEIRFSDQAHNATLFYNKDDVVNAVAILEPIYQSYAAVYEMIHRQKYKCFNPVYGALEGTNDTVKIHIQHLIRPIVWKRETVGWGPRIVKFESNNPVFNV